jgi:hypothetical protein
MKNEEIWRTRAKAWKESGKRSEDFSRELGIDPGQLRSWTSKLGLSKPRQKIRIKAIQLLPRFARVVPSPAPMEILRSHRAKSGVSIRLGKSRVDLRRGFDAATLRSVIAILGEQGR